MCNNSTLTSFIEVTDMQWSNLIRNSDFNPLWECGRMHAFCHILIHFENVAVCMHSATFSKWIDITEEYSCRTCLSFVGCHRSCVPSWRIYASYRRCRRPLRSADNWTCLVKRSRNQFGDHRFATAGPTLWNSLPEKLWQPDITFGQFKQSLKTFMFGYLVSEH